MSMIWQPKSLRILSRYLGQIRAAPQLWSSPAARRGFARCPQDRIINSFTIIDLTFRREELTLLTAGSRATLGSSEGNPVLGLSYCQMFEVRMLPAKGCPPIFWRASALYNGSNSIGSGSSQKVNVQAVDLCLHSRLIDIVQVEFTYLRRWNLSSAPSTCETSLACPF